MVLIGSHEITFFCLYRGFDYNLCEFMLLFT